MTYLEAALSILRAAGRPLSSDEITERALNQGLIVPRGKTPVATMRAALYGGLHRPTNLVKPFGSCCQPPSSPSPGRTGDGLDGGCQQEPNGGDEDGRCPDPGKWSFAAVAQALGWELPPQDRDVGRCALGVRSGGLMAPSRCSDGAKFGGHLPWQFPRVPAPLPSNAALLIDLGRARRQASNA